jgi:hypothetical protein
MDTKSSSGYPASSLSNFVLHPFILDGVEVSLTESFHRGDLT